MSIWNIPHKHQFIFYGCLVLALFLRFINLFEMIDIPDPTTDGRFYISIAQEMVHGEFWQNPQVFSFNPLYVVFLAIVTVLGGSTVLIVRVCQVLLGIVLCLIIYIITAKLFQKKTALLALFISTLYLPFLFFETQILNSILVITILFWGISTLLVTDDRVTLKIRHIISSGLIIGVACLGSPNFLIVVVPSIIYLLFLQRTVLPLKDRFVRTILFILSLILPILPVTYWNYSVSNEFIPISSHGFVNLYIGNNPNANGTFQPLTGQRASVETTNIYDARNIAERDSGRKLTHSEISRFWLNKVIHFISSDPTTFVKVISRKLFLFMNAYEIPSNNDLYFMKSYSLVLQLPLLSYGIIFPLALLGMFLSFKRGPRHQFVIFLYAMLVFSIIIFFVSARYRLITVPLVIVFCSYGFCWMLDSIKQRKIGPLIGASCSLICLYIFVYQQSPIRGDKAFGHFNMAEAYRISDNYEEAKSEYQSCLNINPAWVEARLKHAETLYKLKEYDQALLQLEICQQQSPDNPHAHYLLGLVFAELKKMKQAKYHFARALQLNPDYKDRIQIDLPTAEKNQMPLEKSNESKVSIENLLLQGEQYYKNNDLETAINQFKEILTISPGNFQALVGLSMALIKSNDYKQALSVCKEIITIDPTHAPTQKNLAFIYSFKIKDAPKAIYHIEKYLDLNPTDPQNDKLRITLQELKRK